MSRSNKTSNVLKLLNLSDAKSPDTAAEHGTPSEPAHNCSSPSPEISDTSESAPPRKKRARKAIVKHMNLEKLSDSREENPALKSFTAAEGEEKLFVRLSGERQIVSVPLLLINEQLGMAVERFNSCACDECLRGITDKALDLMPPLYVRVIASGDENEVNRLIKERRAEAIRILAKICITANKKPFHENNN
ncbi:MAG: hypothetical protein FWG70_09155 [Oscillospiraceae bacterium]|nr:hypothetical protein [Oscillospiraceae bacterium]